jgi:CHASE2 domain-containing sensor protein
MREVGAGRYGVPVSTSSPRPKARGILFFVLAAGLVGLGYAAVRQGVWVIAVAAAAIGLWMADLALRDFGVRGARGGR